MPMDMVSSFLEAKKYLADKEYGLCRYTECIDEEDRTYRVEKTPVGLFKVEEGEIYGEESEFTLSLPKVEPVVWLRIQEFFKVFARRGLEVAVNLFYDMEKKKYLLFVPQQEVNPVHCTIHYSDRWQEIASRCLFVAEIHSHHVMRAQFSDIDNADEKGSRIFGVWGNYMPATDFLPEFSVFTFRAGSGGFFAKMRTEDFLEDYYSRANDSVPELAIESMFKPVTVEGDPGFDWREAVV